MNGQGETFRIFGLEQALGECRARKRRLSHDRIAPMVEKFDGRVIGRRTELSEPSESGFDPAKKDAR